ncbi:MAG: endo-1,4-beta-xylanase [Promethearchaeia archaeon]
MGLIIALLSLLFIITSLFEDEIVGGLSYEKSDWQGDALYNAYFKKLFNLATIPFYWRQYEPTRGEYPMDDWIMSAIAWCRQNNITTKGHPLAWHNQAGYPDWLPEDDDKVEQLLEARIDRINTLVGFMGRQLLGSKWKVTE